MKLKNIVTLSLPLIYSVNAFSITEIEGNKTLSTALISSNKNNIASAVPSIIIPEISNTELLLEGVYPEDSKPQDPPSILVPINLNSTISNTENNIKKPIYDEFASDIYVYHTIEDRVNNEGIIEPIKIIKITDEIIQNLNKRINKVISSATKIDIENYLITNNINNNNILTLDNNIPEVRDTILSYLSNLSEETSIPISFNKAKTESITTRDAVGIKRHYQPNSKLNKFNQHIRVGKEQPVSSNEIIFKLEDSFANQLNKTNKKQEENISNINLNSKEIIDNKNNININRLKILSNKDVFNINTQNINQNKENIQTNKENIQTNKENIQTNKENIDKVEDNVDNIKTEYLTNLHINGFGEKNIKNHFGSLYSENSIIRSDINRFDNEFKQFKSDTHNRFYKVEKKANQGIASVAAMSNLPFTDSATFSTAIGVGNYRNAIALAWGMQYRINQNVKVRASTAWNDSNHWVSAGGIGISW